MISDLKCRRQDVTLVTDRWTCGLGWVKNNYLLLLDNRRMVCLNTAISASYISI